MSLLTEYWPWWLGGSLIAFISIAYYHFLGVPCGVSGTFGKVVHWKSEAEALALEQRMRDNAAQVEQKMMAQALAELDNLPEEMRREVEAELKVAQQANPRSAANTNTPLRPHPSAHLLFLVSLAAGGFIAALVSGKFALSWDMGVTYTRFFGTGISEWLVLFTGGMLVGFGTHMAGGCTMGHGITGNSSLQPGSFIATAAFFGTAVLLSFLLRFWL